MSSKQHLIKAYAEKGWQMIPIRPSSKGAMMEKGQSYTDIATTDPDKLKGNIGIILGEPSGFLVDVDIDDERALPYVHRFLPTTPTVFGRKSKPRSHWLYICEDAKTCKFSAEKKSKPIEIRASPSEQTVFPGSIHPSKEKIEWEPPFPSDPSQVEFEALQKCVQCLTVVQTIIPFWEEGSRNDLASALSGYLLKHDIDFDLVAEVVETVCDEVGDAEKQSRLDLVKRAEERILEDKPVRGYTELQEILGEEVASQISKIFKTRKKKMKDQSKEVDYVLVFDDVLDAQNILEFVVAKQQANNSQTLFSINGIPSLLQQSNSSFAMIKTTDNTRLTINRNITLGAVKGEEQAVQRLKAVPENLLSLIKEMLWEDQDWLPKIETITAGPFIDSSGMVQDRIGYHEADHVYCFNKNRLPNIATNPNEEELKAAIDIIDDVLVDFPFAHESDKAHAWAYLLLPFIREHIGGLTPLHFVDKPVQGTGGTFLCQIGGAIANGSLLPPTMLPKNEEEFSKVITAKSKSSNQHLFFDNVRFISSDHYASMITSEYCEGRVLGKSEMVLIRNKFIHVMSGNNINLDVDFNRRLVRILLDANTSQPELRTFKHPYLAQHIRDNRGAIVGALLTVIGNWFAQGKPLYQGKLKASFEAWSQVIGGILESAGIPGFLQTPQDEHSSPEAEQADSETEFLSLWVSRWLAEGKRSFSAKELLMMAKDDSLEIAKAPRGEHNSRSFGKLLSVAFKRKIRPLFANDINNPMNPPTKIEFKTDCAIQHNRLEWYMNLVDQSQQKLVDNLSPSAFYSGAAI